MNLKEYYSREFISRLADEFFLIYHEFDKKAFIKNTCDSSDWNKLELKQRMRKITTVIHSSIPFKYHEQLKLLNQVAPKFSGIQGLVFPDFIQVYGLNDLKISLKALEFYTEFSTSEFAIRPFIEKYPKECISQLLNWSRCHNHHVRRLSSEGSRPKLPWAQSLTTFVKNPTPCLPILENLKNDESLYVRKSVANHLNDISKNYPDLVLNIGKKWYGVTKNTDWIVKHALRTLLKAGNKTALDIVGTSSAKDIDVVDFRLSSEKIKIGSSLSFSFELINNHKSEHYVRLEYFIYFVKSNGTKTPKIFKIREVLMPPNSQKSLSKKHQFADLTTRKHYSGTHRIEIVVNGEVKCLKEFELL